MRRFGIILLLTGTVALMMTLTVTTVQGMKHNESPKTALAKAPKLAIDKVKSSIKKLALEVKSGSNHASVLVTGIPSEQTQTALSAAAQAATIPIDAKPFELWDNDKLVASYNTFVEAVGDAKTRPNVRIAYRSQSALVWTKDGGNKDQVHIDVALIEQMPELERGCEVTSLAMLLQSAGLHADKMTLSQQIKKDPTPFDIVDGERYFGNPNKGFVGDIETFDNPGYGVYHEPVKELADKYLPGRVVDATGADFADLYTFLDQGIPIWTIVNVDFDTLPEDDFEQWQTPDGPINITYKEHSVLVTGYDDEYIYINDPLNEDDKVEKNSFIAAWEQMGKQAISYVPNSESKAGKT